MKNFKKLTLIFSAFLSIFLSNVLCMKRSIDVEQDREVNKRCRPDNFIRPVSDQGAFFLEMIKRELRREAELEIKRDIELKDLFIKEAEDISPRLKELLLEKSNDEFIQDFVNAYIKIIEMYQLVGDQDWSFDEFLFNQKIAKEDFKKLLDTFFRIILFSIFRDNAGNRFSMIYSLMFIENLFIKDKQLFEDVMMCFFNFTMSWALVEKVLYDDFYRSKVYFEYVSKGQDNLSSEFLLKEEIAFLSMLNWSVNFSSDKIKNFVEFYFSNKAF